MSRITGTNVGIRTEPDYRGQPDRYCGVCGIKMSSANHSRKPPESCKDCWTVNPRWVKWLRTR